MDNSNLRVSPPAARWFTIGFSVFLASASSLCLAAAPAPAAADGDLELARRLEGAFEKVADQTSPSVVVITTKHKVAGAPETQDGEQEDNTEQFQGTPFEFFFKHLPQGHPRDVESQGSGVILRRDGYILTNQHVIDQADTITVELKDGTKFDAKVVGVDDRIDVAVIKVDAKNLAAAKIGDSDRVRVGQWAIAIGAPYELDYSFTVGFVSAKGRTGVASRGGNAYEDYIQTDAAINPGNSGGPLCDIEGRVIGVNTLIRGLNRGIGFAIPINMAMDSAEKLITDGKVKRPWIGIGINEFSEDKGDLAEYVKNATEGVVVKQITDGAPAAKSDLKLADVIVAVDGVPVKTPRELQQQILRKKIGQKVILNVVRGDKTIPVALQTEEMRDELQTVALERHTKPQAESAFGLTVQAVTKELAERLKLEITEGLVVTDVADGSTAQQKGLRRGDVITAIDRAPARSVEDFKTAVSKADEDKRVLLFVHRGHASTFVVLKDSK
jgi:serine protease Do